MATTSFEQDFIIDDEKVAKEIAEKLEKSQQQVDGPAVCYTAREQKELAEKEQRALAIFQNLLRQSR